MTKLNGRTSLMDWLLAVSLSLASAAVVFWQNARLTVLWDLSYILENSYRISLGDVPYRDFPFPYAPLTFLVQAALIRLTGRVFFHHVIYCAVVAAISTLVTWLILLKVLQSLPRARILALVLVVPLTVLGIYAVFPHPFYDPDCSLAVLVSLLLLSDWDRETRSIIFDFLTGLLLPLPIFIKQNTGLAFICSAIAGLCFLFVLDLIRRRSVLRYLWLLLGVLVTLGIALGLIHAIAGLQNYVRWTVEFAAERRTPAWKEMLGIYATPQLKWWLAVFLCGVILLSMKKGPRWLRPTSVCLMLLPYVWPVIYLFRESDSSERAERLVNLFPFTLILVLFVVVLTFRRRKGSELLLVITIVGTIHGAFLSQQLWGSTYALWPFFMILVALILAGLSDLSTFKVEGDEVSRVLPTLWPTIFASVVSLGLLVAGTSYLRSHERLDYADLDDGDLMHSKLPALKGLSMRGSWIPDFEQLVSYIQKEIPQDDGILCLPGEDLFYYTTGRRPHFPVLMFDHTVNPLSPQQIVDIARERNVQWLITKDDLQLEEEPLEQKDELMSLLMKDFESVESLDNYEIYKRKSPESNQDNDSDDDEQDEAQKP